MRFSLPNNVQGVVSILLLFSSANSVLADEREEALQRLEAAANALPRGIAGVPAQWFKMNSAIGWEKMMLVFGYVDNRTTCNNMLEMAYAENTQRDFRCTPAN